MGEITTINKNTYVIFTVNGKTYIDTDSTDHQYAEERMKQLQKMFPNNEWDISNADWTRKCI